MDSVPVQRKSINVPFGKPNLFFGDNSAILPMERELSMIRVQPKFSMEPEMKQIMESRRSGILSRDYSPTFCAPIFERVPLHLSCTPGERNARPAVVNVPNPNFVAGGMLPSSAAPEVKRLKKAGLIE